MVQFFGDRDSVARAGGVFGLDEVMKFEMKYPCPHCPFRNDEPGYLRGARMQEIVDDILYQDMSFTCHETTVPCDDDDGSGEMTDGPNAQHCAGAMIFLEHNKRANQSMRIGERFKMYDSKKLKMDAPVFEDEESLVDHHAEYG